jgi:AcrR family transcriptional regulator
MKGKRTIMHRGEALQAAVSSSGLSITKVVKRAGYSRSSYYIHITDKLLPFDILREYAKALKHDFSAEFPEMGKLTVQEDEEDFGDPDTLEKALKQRNNWRDKYYGLLEKYNKLLEAKVK